MQPNETQGRHGVLGSAGRRRAVLSTATVLGAVLLGGCGGGAEQPDLAPTATIGAGQPTVSSAVVPPATDPTALPGDDGWVRLYESYGPRLGSIDCTTDTDPVRCMGELADLERQLTADVERSAPGPARSELLDALDDLEDEIEDYYDDRCDLTPGDRDCTEELEEAVAEARDVHRVLERVSAPN